MKQVIRQSELKTHQNSHGNTIHVLHGYQHGLRSTSLILSETVSGDGSPAHRHPTEEVHVIQQGRATYYVDEQTFEAEAGNVAVIPAGAYHRFVNSGTELLRLAAFFPTDRITVLDDGVPSEVAQ